MTEFFVVLLIAALIRIAPKKLSPHGIGVDQWVWKALIDELRRGSRLPPHLPQFLLDEKQWTPPMFMLLMAWLPRAVFDRYSGLLAVAIDLARLALAMLAVRHMTGSDAATAITGIAYGLTPLLVTYNLQLNPRGLAALLFDGILLAASSALFLGGSPWLWVWITPALGVLLLTHKMTTQLLWFVCLGASLVLLDARLLLLIPASILLALVLSAGYYRYVLLAHADIVSFWFKNWQWSGSNPVLESPIYGDPGYESPSKFYRRGAKAWVRRLSFVIGFSPWVPLAGGSMLIAIAGGYHPTDIEWVLFVWLALVFALSVSATVIPALRCIGQGYLYGYNGAFPAALLVGVMWTAHGESWYWRAAFVAGLAASSVGLVAFFRALLASRTLRIDENLDRAIKALAQQPEGVVMCLPQHWHDAVAYRANKPVLFGGHGYGFRHLQPLFPRFLVPVGELIEKHRVAYLLTYVGYCNERFLAALPEHDVDSFGEYRLYRFRGASSPKGMASR